MKLQYKNYKIPENFDGHELIRIYPTNDKEISGDKLNYLVSQIYAKAEVNREDRFKGFAFLNAKILRQRIRGYNHNLKYLKLCGVIEIIPHSQNFHPKGYKLMDSYLTKFRRVSIPIETFVKSRKKKQNVKPKLVKSKPKRLEYVHKKSKVVNNFKEYSHLVCSFNNKLEIDYLKAILLAKKLAFKNGDKYANVRFNQMVSKIEKIQMENPELKVDGFGKRYYSPITNLPKKLRNCVTYGGELLCGLDIKSSLPFMLGLLAHDLNINGIGKSQFQPFLSNIINIYRRIKKEEKEKEERTPNKLHKSIRSLDIQEIQQYMKLVTNPDSDIYEYFAEVLLNRDKNYLNTVRLHDEETGITLPAIEIFKGLSQQDYNRAAAKALMVRILSAKHNKSLLHFRIFEKEFPTISNFLQELKNQGDAINRHKCSSQILQNMESYLVLNVISRRFVNEFQMPVYTIHDNMATLITHHQKLKNIAHKEFKKLSDFVPNFHIEPWYEIDSSKVAA